MRTTHRVTTKHCNFVGYYLIRFIITWLDFGEILLNTVILANFLSKFFKVKHYFGHISGMVGRIDVKRKGSALVGYWVQYVTLTFDLTHDLDLRCFKVKFRNRYISRIVGLIDVKWKGNELIWYWANVWPCSLTTPMTWTWSFKVRVWIGFISEMGQPIDNER